MSLVDITKAASAENAAILLHADDNEIGRAHV